MSPAGHISVSAYILPAIAASDPGYVDSLLVAATGRGVATADIGLMQPALAVSGVTYLVGGVLYGIALF